MNHKKKSKIPTNILFLILSIICVLFLLISYVTNFSGGFIATLTNATFAPMQSGFEKIGFYVSKKREKKKTIEMLTYENKSLKKQIKSLTSQLNQIQLKKSELLDLQKLYNLDKQYLSYKKTGARIIARSSDNWFNTFTIDKGTAHGIKKDMNVIADGGLVGIVIKVGSHHSIVRAIIDDSSNVSGMSLNTSNNCIVSGNLESMTEDKRIKFSNLEDEKKAIKTGEPIVTSNISDKYLPGILIGYVDTIKLDQNKITYSGTITPVVDFKHLQNVLVILTRKDVKN